MHHQGSVVPERHGDAIGHTVSDDADNSCGFLTLIIPASDAGRRNFFAAVGIGFPLRGQHASLGRVEKVAVSVRLGCIRVYGAIEANVSSAEQVRSCSTPSLGG